MNDAFQRGFKKTAFKSNELMNALVWPIAAGVGINLGTTALMKTMGDDDSKQEQERIRNLVRTQVSKMVMHPGGL